MICGASERRRQSAAAKARPLKPLSASRSRGAGAAVQQVFGDVAVADGGGDDAPGADDPAAQVGLDGEPEAVEPLGVGGVAAEPGGQVVAGAGPLVRAANPGRDRPARPRLGVLVTMGRFGRGSLCRGVRRRLAPSDLAGVDAVDEAEDGLRQLLGGLHRGVVADAVELDGTDL
jgi:hypothetical protein